MTLRGDARPQRPNYYTVLPSIQRQVLYVDKPVVLRGGYTRANWTLPDSAANPTTLNAGGLGRVALISTTAPVSLEGLRFVGGNASGLLGKDMNGDETDYYYGAGGGITYSLAA